jgi:hypothetical protein
LGFPVVEEKDHANSLQSNNRSSLSIPKLQSFVETEQSSGTRTAWLPKLVTFMSWELGLAFACLKFTDLARESLSFGLQYNPLGF